MFIKKVKQSIFNKLFHKSSSKKVRLDTGVVFRSGEYHTTRNSQSEIKIHSMRLYDIARNPSLMTEYERECIQNDRSLWNQYQNYVNEIREKGY